MKPKVLIIDDASENIHILSNMLKDDYKIIAATSGEKGIQLAKKDPKPDIIILDIIMPDMDGYEVCKILKDDPLTEDIPVVFLTSLNNTEDIEKGFACGGAEFISKPVVKSIVKTRLLNQLKIKNKKDDFLLEIKAQSKDTILIVDDAPENVELIMEILKEDYNVIFANSGEKALEILSVQKPDLILLDILMPDMDGYEMCEKIKDDINLKDIPIIFLTILENSKDIVRGLNLGAVDYVCKPVEPVVLKAKINTHIKLKHYQDKLKDELSMKDNILLRQSKFAILGEMFENITHQWKQPLSIISLSNETIKLEKDFGQLNDESLFGSLGDIENSTKYLVQTIDDFRGFLKDNTVKEYFNVKEVIDKTLDLLSAKLKNKGINVQNNISDCEVYGKRNDLVQVLMNILSNAIDALDANDKEYKEIFISANEINGNLTIEVIDNAGGIDEEIKDKIFDKYITTKSSTQGGTGIGLYMSKKLVEDSLKGKITCSNIENGASFKIVFPVK
jgi:response regulator RpfG family c-di-GMP phosphodiesterase